MDLRLPCRLLFLALALRAGVSNLMARNVNREVPTWHAWPCFYETSDGANAGTNKVLVTFLRSATPNAKRMLPFSALHVGASWSLRLLEDEQMGGPGQGPTPALPLFLSVDCCLSFLTFQVTHSVPIHQHFPLPFCGRSERLTAFTHSRSLPRPPAFISRRKATDFCL
jgi:hypothetical protein